MTDITSEWPTVGKGRLNGKRALVSGAGRGIGRAIATLFALEGAAVAGVDIDKQAISEAVKDMRGPQKAVGLTGDVTKASSVEGFVNEAASALGGLDIVVNNVGLSGRGTVETTAEADWDRISLNTKSVYLISKYAVPHLRAAGGGSIVNLGSGTGVRGSANVVAYGTAKSGVIALTKLMALDHAAEGIRVNCVCPGLTDTDLSRSNRERYAKAHDMTLEETNKLMTKNYPLGRMGRPLDIAYGVLYMSSDEACWVTGTTLLVDGGRCAGHD
jgi:NAD(P)-dependent dehydrogenase (short-subunit alcohol dehydrogenase family)